MEMNADEEEKGNLETALTYEERENKMINREGEKKDKEYF